MRYGPRRRNNDTAFDAGGCVLWFVVVIISLFLKGFIIGFLVVLGIILLVAFLTKEPKKEKVRSNENMFNSVRKEKKLLNLLSEQDKRVNTMKITDEPDVYFDNLMNIRANARKINEYMERQYQPNAYYIKYENENGDEEKITTFHDMRKVFNKDIAKFIKRYYSKSEKAALDNEALLEEKKEELGKYDFYLTDEHRVLIEELWGGG